MPCEETITFQIGCDASHAKRLAELIDSTDPALHRFLFKATGDPVRAITQLAAAYIGFFSHNHAHVAVCDRNLVGICLSFLPDHYHQVLDEVAVEMNKSFGPLVAGEVKAALHALMEITPPFPSQARFVQNFAVEPTRRQQGIGKLLLACEINRAAKMGCNVIALDVNVENVSAIKLYSSFNGIITGEWSATGIGLDSYFRMHIPVPPSRES
jgi:ribosomal protein S18 acetylase RimI-like enzyme